jgi:predicted choloylglycine hydrolase
MSTFPVQVVQCRGTSYEIGRQQAEIFATTPKGRVIQRRRQFRAPQWFDVHAEERAFSKYAPLLWEEIGGIADGLRMSMDEAAFRFGNGGLRPPLGGCSAVMTDGIYGRNYDFQPARYGARIALVHPSGCHASIGSSELLTGRLDGMNEHGLTVGLHLVRISPLYPGLSCVVMIRIVLDQCATTEEAVAVFRRLPHAMHYNYSILDARGAAAVVEAAPGSVAVRTGDALVCTNHFQTPLLRSLNRNPSRSIQRLPPLEAWAKEKNDANGLYANLNNSTSPAFHHDYLQGSGTLHTMVTEPANRRVIFGVGGDAGLAGHDMIDLDLRAWRDGGNLGVTRLAGQLGGTSKPLVWTVAKKPRKVSMTRTAGRVGSHKP